MSEMGREKQTPPDPQTPKNGDQALPIRTNNPKKQENGKPPAWGLKPENVTGGKRYVVGPIDRRGVDESHSLGRFRPRSRKKVEYEGK